MSSFPFPLSRATHIKGGTIIGSHAKPHMNNIGNSLHAKDYLDKHPQVTIKNRLVLTSNFKNSNGKSELNNIGSPLSVLL